MMHAQLLLLLSVTTALASATGGSGGGLLGGLLGGILPAVEPLVAPIVRPIANLTNITAPLAAAVNTVTAPIAQAVAPVTAPVVNSAVGSSVNNTVGNLTTNNVTAAANATGNLTAASTAAPFGVCPTQCIRREVRSLSPQQWSAYAAAVKALQSGPAPTKYDQLVKMHIDAAGQSHGTPYFLPWHRAYLRQYELALQAIDPSVCLNYFNSALDSQAPELSLVLSPQYYGGGSGQGGCVTSAVGSYQAYYPQPHCVRRDYTDGSPLSAFHSVEAVNRIVTSSADYDTFRSRIESIVHPVVHNSIGGDMATMASPNDYLFWAHHAWIDFIWTKHQARNGYDFNGAGADRAAQLQLLTYNTDQAMDNRKLCYDYVDLADSDLADDRLPPPRVAQPPNGSRPDRVSVIDIPSDENARWSSHDRSNLNSLRFPDQISDAWCSMNKLDVNIVRQYEDEYRTVYRQLNSIKGYLSPCCLWKRSSLCRKLVGKVDKFCMDVQGVGRLEVGYDESDPAQCVSDVCQRAVYTTPDVELPPEAYRSEIQKLVGASAFDGAGSMKVITDMDHLAAGVKNGAMLGAAAAAAVLVPALMALA